MTQSRVSLPPAIAGGKERTRAVARRLVVRLRQNLLRSAPKIRRAVDATAAGAGLLVLSPVLITAAAAVKLNSPGPILFKQERFGKNGRRFAMLKFRTMVVNADALKTQLEQQQTGVVDGVRFKMKRDPRITTVGRILRRYSVDELPQLFNVLVGDMALIGPRPAIWREVSKYDPRALRRLEVEQGLTCFWQVSGRSDLSFDQQVELDIDYVDNTTVFDELKILARTVPAVLSGRGAY